MDMMLYQLLMFTYKILHIALLKQLEYEADHGCVVVMETETGKVRAISNLGRANDGTYYEQPLCCCRIS
jgi:cell division protein FtsI (penicillin-binding protein 3)